jgi:hypothetical protein
MEFEKVIRGILKYLNNEVYTDMADWQEMLARLAVSRIIGDEGKLKKMLMENGFVRTFDIIDEHGNVDVDGLMRDIKRQIEAKGKLEFSIPMLGKFSFVTSDVDTLHRYIKEA